MTNARMTKKKYPYQVIKEYGDELYCLELIQFFGWHPDTSFCELAILHALSVSGERRYVEKALHQLIDKGLVKTYSENNIAFYCLTDDETLRQLALYIAGLDWRQWQAMLRQNFGHLQIYISKRKLSSTSAAVNS